MKGLEKIIADNEAAGSGKYMRKFIVETPSWAIGEHIVALSQNHVKATYLHFDSEAAPNNKKFLITITAEEV